MAEPEVDALIIGGGPAGSTAATVLATAGRSVLLCERESFPRFHIGESLLPYNVPLFRRLGIWERLKKHGFQRKWGASFVIEPSMATTRLNFERCLDRDAQMALQVRRAEFDEALLRHAEERGTKILEEHAVEEVLFEEDRAVGAMVVGAEGKRREIRSRWVLDASGRNAVLGKQLGIRRRDPDLRQAALFAHYEGASGRRGPEGGDTIVNGGPWGWFWLIPLDAETTSVGVVFPGRILRQRGGDLGEKLDGLVSCSRVVSEALGGARRVTEVEVAADFSYSCERLVGPGWTMIGDAAGFLDPVFSSGVLLATRCGEAAARRLARALAEPGRVEAAAMHAYERFARRGLRRFRRYVLAYYLPATSDVFASPIPKLIEAPIVSSFAGKVFENDPRIWLSDGLFQLAAAKRQWLVRKGRLELPEPPASDVRRPSR